MMSACCLLLRIAILSVIPTSIVATCTLRQRFCVESRTTIAGGWHPWYEIKSDPADESALIACGMEWDSGRNAFQTFVYSSTDEGINWTLAMLDRSSLWVSETSCAFGPNHMAYLISEASNVVDGSTQHYRGTGRLFVSSDSGQHWKETLQTGWTDYSTSAVSARTGKLYTFYQERPVPDRGGNLISSVGMLVFPADGTSVSGPYTIPELVRLGFQGLYPSNALPLKDGSVVSLFLGTRKLPDGAWEDDLWLERIDPSSEGEPNAVLITRCSRARGYRG